MRGLLMQAAKWCYWQEKNPAMDVYVGRQRAVREKRKLTDEQTRELLAALPEDVRLICMMSLFCTLRTFEVPGLQWKHIDWTRGAVMVRRRFYRESLLSAQAGQARLVCCTALRTSENAQRRGFEAGPITTMSEIAGVGQAIECGRILEVRHESAIHTGRSFRAGTRGQNFSGSYSERTRLPCD